MSALPTSTNERIFAEALRLFALHGYSAVSIREIAEAVGVRQGAIYNHVTSKQMLLADLMIGHMMAVLSALDEAVAGVSGAENRLRAFVRFHVSFHIDHPDHVFIAYMELRSLESENLGKINAMRDAYEKRLRSILDEGRQAGVFSFGDLGVQTRALLAMLTGVTVWYREGGELDRDAVVESYVQAAVQSVGLSVDEKAA